MPFPSRFHTTALALACTLCLAVPAHAAAPPLLAPQIERLAALLGDSYAKAYPQGAMGQAVGLPDGRVDAGSGKTQFLIPALANAPGDALNFPSRKTVIRLEFERRLTEVGEAAP